ncbi:docking protein 1 [Amphiprion ocellaris]|uniref:IRS-type PTB domain-containing protein n=1 Tax=Amphiprion ocellaris TaxID=80972 RepID=A0AAQ5YMT8_AMPOC|nr:docking protein 1 [Amphiprion ocellaris]
MDSHGKSGKVYLRPHKAGKKWKPVWLSLFPPSSSGVGRLEIQDMGGGGSGGNRKVVRLLELISVLRLPPNAEACPTENMAAFCVETRDRTMVFAAPKGESMDWVDKLCLSTFQTGGSSASSQRHMEENQIYASADEAPQFWVVVQRTDAAARCDLQGAYWLQVDQEALLLRETQKEKKIVGEWPYELLRRYGKDKSALTIEAGRRCDSGPGTFTFETQQAENIFSLIQSTIKQKTSSGNHNLEAEKVVVANIQAHSPIPKIPDVTSMATLLENQLRTLGRKSPALDEGSPAQVDLVSKSEPSQPAPITLMPLPLVPTHEGGPHRGQSDGIYADPSDCIQPVPKATTALYVDPASVLPLKPPGSRDPPVPRSSPRTVDSVYSEVYDRISPDHNKQNVLQRKANTNSEPIYTEPVSNTDKVSPRTETKPDPFEHLYAKVCKTPPSSSPTSSPTGATSTPSSSTTATKTSQESLEDVIYENLGII